MKEMTCIVLGGGYAGIHAVQAIQKAWKAAGNHQPLRLILMDKNKEHIRKVLLFKPAATQEDIAIPLKKLFPEGVEILQGSVIKIEKELRSLVYLDAMGMERTIQYQMLVVAAGSVVRQPEPRQGGIALTNRDTARSIRKIWQSNLAKAAHESDSSERKRLMTIAIAGAGISGIETAAELAHYARQAARRLDLDPKEIQICLYNANNRLFPEGPAKVGHRLEQALNANGVKVIHGIKVQQEEGGVLTLSSGKKTAAGLCIWTLGLRPNPMLEAIGLPVNKEGYIRVDESYRVEGAKGVYSIGDCAHIVDPASGRADGKTCKEATGQAAKLGRVIVADAEGRTAPKHHGYMDFFCFGLGPGQGMVWTRQWGIDFVITGKLGWKIREFTWNRASLLN